jgi:glucosamine--fructose-6-phosphate aminotransferase (isomerizing)
VQVEPASEFRYRDPVLRPGTLVLAFTQSGETADTIAAVRQARAAGAPVIAVTNVVGSAVTMEADGVVQMQAGPEIGVAASKTFLTQVACGLLLALRLGDLQGVLSDERHRELVRGLLDSPDLVRRTLQLEPVLAELAQRFAHCRSAMFIGRGINFPVALEGALKLKEISYVHAEGYAAGELKHGPIALLEADVPVVAVATQGHTFEKTVSNIQEARVRQSPVIAVVTEGDEQLREEGTELIHVPACDELVSPLVSTVALQLFAYHMAVRRGCDVDQPRNLAKSVTVE